MNTLDEALAILSREQPLPQSATLSDNDYDEVLASVGFPPASEEPEGRYEVGIDTDEEHDLDAEEDEDWDRLEEAGVISPAQESSPFLTTDGTPAEEEAEREEEEAIHPEGTSYLIEPNSPEALVNETTSRFSGAEWFEEIKKSKIILAGLGGIGSWTALQLARMSPNKLVLYDDDIVEPGNMSGQLYGTSSVSYPKADAICKIIRDFAPNVENLFGITGRFTSDTEAGDIMICGFDNMEARKTFFNSWVAHIENKSLEEKKKCLFIDGRLSIDTLQVFCLTGDDYANQERYIHDFLFSDDEADSVVCSLKQTSYMACMIGSFIVNLFTNHIANLLDPIIPYDLPFFTEYNAQSMIFKTEN